MENIDIISASDLENLKEEMVEISYIMAVLINNGWKRICVYDSAEHTLLENKYFTGNIPKFSWIKEGFHQEYFLELKKAEKIKGKYHRHESVKLGFFDLADAFIAQNKHIET